MGGWYRFCLFDDQWEQRGSDYKTENLGLAFYCSYAVWRLTAPGALA